MAHLRNPQDAVKVIHIAGTSGKTSTAYYVRALLEAAGARTALTVSPHIETIRERVQVGGQPLDEAKFVAYFNAFYPLVHTFDPQPTFFELMTAFFYWICREERVDYAVVETGVGGRLDATNTVSRPDKVCVLTPIGYDHTDILGETLPEIAGEKAGIIQPYNTVFSAVQEAAAAAVFEQVAGERQAKLSVVSAPVDETLPAAPFLQQNFQLALAVVQFIAGRDGLTLPSDLSDPARILQETTVPGRFETYHVGDVTVLLDGAHNPQKLTALFGTLTERKQQPAVVVAAFSEAPRRKILKCVDLVVSFALRTNFTVFTVQRDVLRRSVPLDGLRGLTPYGSYFADPMDALDNALRGSEPYIVVTGSLYLVSVLRPYVQQLASA